MARGVGAFPPRAQEKNRDFANFCQRTFLGKMHKNALGTQRQPE